jgi:hypothetical protein
MIEAKPAIASKRTMAIEYMRLSNPHQSDGLGLKDQPGVKIGHANYGARIPIAPVSFHRQGRGDSTGFWGPPVISSEP